MKVTFSMLCDQLEQTHVLYVSSSPGACFQDVQILEQAQAYYFPETLYICNCDDLKNLLDSLPPKILCIGELDEPARKSCSDRCQMLLIETPLSLEKVRQRVSSALKRYHVWADRLLSAMIKGKGFFRYLEIAHEMLTNPIWIVDDNNCLVAYTKDDQYDDEAWRETVRTGYISFMGSSATEIEEVEHKFRTGSAPAMIKIEHIRDPLVSSKIIVDNKNIAIMNVIASHHAITAGQVDICRYVCDILSLEFRNSKLLETSREHTSSQLLLDLISGQLTESGRIDSRLERIQWKPGSGCRMLAIPCRSLGLLSRNLEKLAHQLIMVLSGCISVVYKEQIVCLLSNNQKEILDAHARERLEAFLLEYQLYAGISDLFSNLTEVCEEYHHALQAVSAASGLYPKERIHYYEDYAFLSIRNILAEHRPVESFCSKGLFRLMEHDRQKGTDYTRTLFLYLKNNLSPGKTAEELFIHRCTLNYRLTKIQQIAQMDLANSDQVFLLNLSYRLLGYQPEQGTVSGGE